MGARREVLAAVADRSRSAGRQEKGRILDELAALGPRHRLDDEAAIASDQRQAFRPVRCDIRHRQCLDERARHAHPSVSDHVDLAVARRRVGPVGPVVERADRNLAPDRRVKADASSPTTGGRDLHVHQQPVDRRRAHR